jgi:hydroxyethylthiazole kinase
MNCIIAISGATDMITDGRKIFQVFNGHPIMTKVTGMGCGLSAVTGAFCAVSDGELLAATAAAFGVYGLCGERSIKVSDKPGSFFVAFIDSLYSINQKDMDTFYVTS